MSQRTGPCSWPEPLCPATIGDLTPEQIEELKAEAAGILWALTGARFGPCEITSEPAPACQCRGLRWCVCGGACTLVLDGPVLEVLSVTVNGVPVFDWSVHGSTLYGTHPWPVDTVVVYRQGIPWPAGAGRAIGELAHQLGLSACNDSSCKLPAGLKTRTRQGDTIEFADVFAEGGRTGLQNVDLWIAAQRAAVPTGKVWSPDVTPRIDTVSASGSGTS